MTKSKHNKTLKVAIAVLLALAFLLPTIMTQAFATTVTEYVHEQKTEKAQALLDIMPRIGAREKVKIHKYHMDWANKYELIGLRKNGDTGAVTEIIYGWASPFQKFQVDGTGEPVYCIQFELPVSGLEYETSYVFFDDYFDDLTDIAKNGITYSTIYGYPNNHEAGVDGNREWMATQVIIWEYQNNLRTSAGTSGFGEDGFINYTTNKSWNMNAGSQTLAPWSSLSSTTLPSGYTIRGNQLLNQLIKGNAQLESSYKRILDGIRKHEVLPSFTKKSNSPIDPAPTHELKYNVANGRYETTLTDTKGVLANMTVNTPLFSKINAEKQGNNLYVWTTDKKASKTAFHIKKNLPSGDGQMGLVLVPQDNKQEMIMGTLADPQRAYFNVKLEEFGAVKIKKTSDDGIPLRAEFKIQGMGIDQNVKTNTTGEFLLENLVAGTYTITEIVDDNRYKPQAPQVITVKSGETAEVKFHNAWREVSIELNKFSEQTGEKILYNDGIFTLHGETMDVDFDQLLQDYTDRVITLEEFLDPVVHERYTTREWKFIENLTWNSASKNYLNTTKMHWIQDKTTPARNYKVVETKAPTGHVLPANEADRTWTIRLDELTQEEYSTGIIRINNGKVTNKAIIGRAGLVKVDSETGLEIENKDAVFEVFAYNRVTDKYDLPLANMTYDNVAKMYLSPLAFHTYNNMGKFKVIETKAPTNYLLSANEADRTWYFEITKDEEVVLLNTTGIVTNDRQTGKLSLAKLGEIISGYEQEETGNETYPLVNVPVWIQAMLDGGEFELYAEADVKLNGKTIYEKDEKVTTLITSRADYVTYTNMYLGKYYLVEKQAPSGMHNDTTQRYSFEIAYDKDKTVITVEQTITNERQTMSFTFDKFIEENEQHGNTEAYKDVLFGVLTTNPVLDRDDNEILGANELVELINVEPTDDSTTLFSGTSTADFAHGDYELKELTTADGWILNAEPVDFEHTPYAQDVLHFELNLTPSEPLENLVYRQDVKLIKSSSYNGKLLQGAVYGIFNAMTDELIVDGITDENGELWFTAVPASTHMERPIGVDGGYYAQEIEAPDRHHVDDTKHYFDIGETEEIIEIVIGAENDPIIGKMTVDYKRGLPNDGVDNTHPLIPSTGDTLAVILLLAVAIALFFLAKKKKGKLFLKRTFSLLLVFAVMGSLSISSFATSEAKSITEEKTIVVDVQGKTEEEIHALIYARAEQEFPQNVEKDGRKMTLNVDKFAYTITPIKTQAPPQEKEVIIDNLYNKDEVKVGDTVNVDGKQETVKSVKYEAVTLPTRTETVKSYTEYEVAVKEPVYPTQKTVEYTDELTGKTITATIPFTAKNALKNWEWRSDFKSSMAIEVYNAEYYEFRGELIPYNDDKPQLDGKEQLVLDELNLDNKSYRITAVAWAGKPYEKNGVLYRNATVQGDRYTAQFRANYAGTATLPSAQGYRAIATYELPADDTAEPAQVTSTVTALYNVVEQSRLPLIIGSILLVVLAVGFIIIVIYVLSKKKKDKNKEVSQKI